MEKDIYQEYLEEEKKKREKEEKLKQEEQEKQQENFIEDVKESVNESVKTVKELKDSIVNLSTDKLIPFDNQPFRVYTEEEKENMKESIKINGILNPILVRPVKEKKDFYEILSGHNRVMCAKELEIKEVPCIIKEVDDDKAMVILIDTNMVTRENISIMEQAQAYKLKLEAYKRKNIVTKLNNEKLATEDNAHNKIAENSDISFRQIYRLIRLTNLTPEYYEEVNNKKISIKTAEQISYLHKVVQKDLLNISTKEKIKLTEEKIKNIRKLFPDEEKIEYSVLEENLKEEKKQSFAITFTEEEKNKYFPTCNNSKEIKETIISLYENKI